jgi:hypothetical protein
MHLPRPDPAPDGELTLGNIVKLLAEGAGVHHGAGVRVLPQTARFPQHAYIELAGARFPARQPGQLDRAGEPGRSRPDEQDVQLDGVLSGGFLEDQPFERQGALVCGGSESQGSVLRA